MLKVNISQLHGLHIPFYHSNQSAALFVHTSSEKSLAYIIKNWRKYFHAGGSWLFYFDGASNSDDVINSMTSLLLH